jgi:mRNA interferase RelE/StbE
MIQIAFTRRALRDIRKLSPEIRRRVELAIDELFDNVRAGDKLHGDWKGYWKLRTGDYRIIYQIKNENSVEIQYVGHRRRAYRR